MAFARVNSVVLHFEDRGAPQLPTLVFSNSLGTDFRIWDGVVGRLEDRFRIVRYDKRGHGLSEATPAPYALMDHVSDLAALLDDLHISNASVVGLSVGGMIAQGIVALRPDLVSALILCDTAHKIGTEEMWNERITAIEANGLEALVDSVMERWFTAEYRRPDNADFAGYTAMFTRTPLAGYLGTCAALRDADLTESTRALQLPALLIVGDEDGSTTPELVKSTADLIAGSRFEIVVGAGHLPCIEKPDETATLIGDFLSDIDYG